MATDDEQLAETLIAKLEERGAPDAIALTDLMRIERNLMDALSSIRKQIDAIVRRTTVEELGHAR